VISVVLEARMTGETEGVSRFLGWMIGQRELLPTMGDESNFMK